MVNPTIEKHERSDRSQAPTKLWDRTVEVYPPRPKPPPSLIARVWGEDDEKLVKEHGLSDIWIPISESCLPWDMKPSQHRKILTTQHSELSHELQLAPDSQWPSKHCHLAPGAIHPRYKIPRPLEYKAVLGQGGLSAVLKVKHEGKTFALKRMTRRSEFHEECEQMQCIKSELDILKKIRHAHFIQLVGSYTEPHAVGILMTPVADSNLAQYLENFEHDRESEDTLASFFGCLTTAISHLHFFENIRHKDIKPQNILVEDNNVLLTDFGMSLDWTDRGHTTTVDEKRKTPAYCSPEVAMNKPRHSSSDIWSLGCVFFEMAAVLKGFSVSDLQTLLGGRNPTVYWECSAAIPKAMSALKAKHSRWGNVPLDWIASMLQEVPEKRPTARHLRRTIQQTRDGFFGGCCLGETMHSYDTSGSTSSNSSSVSSTSAASGSSASYSLGGSTVGDAPETVYVLHGNVHLRMAEVAVFHNPESSVNWISPGLVEYCRFRKLSLIKRQEFVHGGQKFEASQFVKAEWARPNIPKTRKSDFVIAPPDAPFDIFFGQEYNG